MNCQSCDSQGHISCQSCGSAHLNCPSCGNPNNSTSCYNCGQQLSLCSNCGSWKCPAFCSPQVQCGSCEDSYIPSTVCSNCESSLVFLCSSCDAQINVKCTDCKQALENAKAQPKKDKKDSKACAKSEGAKKSTPNKMEEIQLKKVEKKEPKRAIPVTVQAAKSEEKAKLGVPVSEQVEEKKEGALADVPLFPCVVYFDDMEPLSFEALFTDQVLLINATLNRSKFKFTGKFDIAGFRKLGYGKRTDLELCYKWLESVAATAGDSSKQIIISYGYISETLTAENVDDVYKLIHKERMPKDEIALVLKLNINNDFLAPNYVLNLAPVEQSETRRLQEMIEAQAREIEQLRKEVENKGDAADEGDGMKVQGRVYGGNMGAQIRQLRNEIEMLKLQKSNQDLKAENEFLRQVREFNVAYAEFSRSKMQQEIKTGVRVAAWSSTSNCGSGSHTQWNNVKVAKDNNFVSLGNSNNTFTINEAGIFRVQCRVNQTGSTCYIDLYLNGNVYSRSYASCSTHNNHSSLIDEVMDLKQGDRLQVYQYYASNDLYQVYDKSFAIEKL